MIGITVKGSFDNANRLIDKIRRKHYYSRLNDFGRQGVDILSRATPVDTGKTAASWYYKVEVKNDSVKIMWCNNNKTDTGIPVAVLIRYGHVTGNGGYVQGVDYISPNITPLFEKIAETIWKEVTR